MIFLQLFCCLFVWRGKGERKKASRQQRGSELKKKYPVETGFASELFSRSKINSYFENAVNQCSEENNWDAI